MELKVELFHNKRCTFYQKTLVDLEDILLELGLEPKVEVRLIINQKEADEFSFIGSPTVHVNGQDIDPMAEQVKNFNSDGCRLYIWQDKVFDYPPMEMIKEAIRSIRNL